MGRGRYDRGMAIPDPVPVLNQFLHATSLRRTQPLGNAGGWSGSLLWRIQTDALGAGLPTSPQQFCLRRWPDGTSPDRLRFIHQILTHVAAQRIDFVPAPVPLLGRTGVTLVQSEDNYLWDLCPWLPGIADFHARPTRQRLAAAMRALARFHTAAANHQPPVASTAPAPAIVERIDLVQQLLSGDFDRIEAAVHAGLDANLDLRAVRVLALCRNRLAALSPGLESAAQLRLPLSPAIRDIHHDHVLFTGDEVTGLIDFGALRIDTPLADIARLVGSLVGDDQPARDFALSAYGQLCPLSDQDRHLIDLLDEAGLLLGGLNWLRWLYLERRDMGPLRSILKRLDEILSRLIR